MNFEMPQMASPENEKNAEAKQWETDKLNKHIAEDTEELNFLNSIDDGEQAQKTLDELRAKKDELLKSQQGESGEKYAALENEIGQADKKIKTIFNISGSGMEEPKQFKEEQFKKNLRLSREDIAKRLSGHQEKLAGLR